MYEAKINFNLSGRNPNLPCTKNIFFATNQRTITGKIEVFHSNPAFFFLLTRPLIRQSVLLHLLIPTLLKNMEKAYICWINHVVGSIDLYWQYFFFSHHHPLIRRTRQSDPPPPPVSNRRGQVLGSQ